MSKKAQGISISVVIVAVIALLVLVVLMAIFGGRMGWFGENIGTQSQKNCASGNNNMNGEITPITVPCKTNYDSVFDKFDDIKSPNDRCCVPRT